MKLAFAAAGGLALLCTPASAQPAPPAVQSPSPTTEARALDLAKTVAPADLSLAADLRSGKEVFYAGFRSDPEAAGLERDYPGIVDHLWKAVEPIVRKNSVDSQAAYWTELAQLYAARLTPRELEAVHVFYKSPTGRKAILGMYSAIDVAPLAAEMVGSEKGEMSVSSVRAAVRDASGKVLADMNESDRQAFLLLSRSVSEAKLQALGAAVQELQVKWANQDNPELTAEVDAAVKAAAEQYFRNRKPAE